MYSMPAMELAVVHCITSRVWPRLHDEDFNVRSHSDRASLDWPITYADLRPVLRPGAGRSLDSPGMQSAKSGDLRETPTPCRAVPLFAQGEILARGFGQLGMRVAPLPLAVNSKK